MKKVYTGKAFFKDIWPNLLDFTQFYERIMYNLRRRDKTPQFKCFSYIEKAKKEEKDLLKKEMDLLFISKKDLEDK